MSLTLHQLLTTASNRLEAAGVENARQEARWILQHALAISLGQFHAQRDAPVAPEHTAAANALLTRRARGEPLQYVLGDTEFFGLELQVGPGVLIPRPETERLVEAAVERYPGSGVICDVCTGSGAVALALAATLGPRVPIVAGDISAEAFGYARRNRSRLGLPNVAFWRGDLLNALPRRPCLAMLTANPPYVAAADYAALPAHIKAYEPETALEAGPDGLRVVRRLLAQALPRLTPNAWLLCEIGYDQGRSVLEAARSLGYRDTAILPDYAGKDRILCARPEH